MNPLSILTLLLLLNASNNPCTSYTSMAHADNRNILQTDTITAQITNLHFSRYNGKPVDSLLAHLPAGYTAMKIGGWRSQRLAEVLYINYPNNISVGIHVRNFQFMNPQLTNTAHPTENWNIALFKKETISFSIAFNGPACINGCENINK